MECLINTRCLIIGGTGSLGKKLIERLGSNQETLAVYSRDEAKHWTIKNELRTQGSNHMIYTCVGDIRDRERLLEVMKEFGPRVVIVAAALKQVDTCELSPGESIATNVIGTQNVLWAVDQASCVQKVLFVSTDKACAPVNVYGMCKSLSERLVTSRAININNVGKKYLCTRYGNVLESRGSIVPLFKWQAANSDHISVTDPEMTRYLMTLDESVDLIFYALNKGKSGETYVPKLPSMRIGDLAQIFSDISGKPIKVIGSRPGEKKHEQLVNESESPRTIELDKHYVIGPAWQPHTGASFSYSSDQSVLTRQELEAKLRELGVLDMSLDSFIGRNIEEIKGA